MDSLNEKIKNAPRLPGCYIFKDKSKKVIYVGKSKNIHNRVSDYFCSSTLKEPKSRILADAIVDVEFQTTDSELDAMIKEYHLIQRYKPKFNKQMKKDVKYPLIQISVTQEWPTISVVYERLDNKNVYIDCYPNEQQARMGIEYLGDAFGTPVCDSDFLNKKDRPCLRGQTGKCSAPCQHGDSETYKVTLNKLIMFLKGRDNSIISRIKKKIIERYGDSETAKKLIEGDPLLTERLIDPYTGPLLRLQHGFKKMNNLPTDRAVILFIRPFRSEDLSAFYIDNNLAFGRLNNKEIIEPQSVESFVADWGKPAKCLMQIRAEKHVIILPKRVTPAIIVSKLNEGYSKMQTLDSIE